MDSSLQERADATSPGLAHDTVSPPHGQITALTCEPPHAPALLDGHPCQ